MRAGRSTTSNMLARWASFNGAPSFTEPYFIGWRGGELWGPGITPALFGARRSSGPATCGTFVTFTPLRERGKLLHDPRATCSDEDRASRPSSTRVRRRRRELLVGRYGTNGTARRRGACRTYIRRCSITEPHGCVCRQVVHGRRGRDTAPGALLGRGWMYRPESGHLRRRQASGAMRTQLVRPTVVRRRRLTSGVSTVMVSGFTVRAKVVGVNFLERRLLRAHRRVDGTTAASIGMGRSVVPPVPRLPQPPSGTTGSSKIALVAQHLPLHQAPRSLRVPRRDEKTTCTERPRRAQAHQCSGERWCLRTASGSGSPFRRVEVSYFPLRSSPAPCPR